MAGEDGEHSEPKLRIPPDLNLDRNMIARQPMESILVEPMLRREEEDQQKIDAMVSQVREVNFQLGGKVAGEIEIMGPNQKIVRDVFLFAKTFRGMQDRGPSLVYGVDSRHGPIYVSGDLAARLLKGDSEAYSVDLQQVPTVTEDELQNWLHPITARLT